MSPRPYNLGKRQAPIDAGRQQILDAARRLLGGTASYTAFTVDAVARQADVARATVYYQFGSQAGLLEALCDHLAEIGGLAGLADVFTETDPVQALHRFVACFGRFWAADRLAVGLPGAPPGQVEQHQVLAQRGPERQGEDPAHGHVDDAEDHRLATPPPWRSLRGGSRAGWSTHRSLLPCIILIILSV